MEQNNHIHNFKKFLSSHKKGIIASVISLVAVVSLLFATFNFLIPAYHYYGAKDYIKQKDYVKAYSELKKSGDFKDSYILLKNFHIEYTKEESFKYSDGKLERSYAYERKFDEYGNKIHESCYSNNEISDKQRYDYEYYEDGRVKKKTYTFYNTEDIMLDKAVFEYDKHGNKTHEIDYDEFNNIEYEYKYEYKYNEDNVKIEKTTYYNGIKSNYYKFDDTGYVISYTKYDEYGNADIESSYKYAYEYDDEERMIRGIGRYENSNFYDDFECEYYSNGNLKLTVAYYEDGEVSSRQEYYSNGNQKLIINYNDEGQVIYKQKFNKKGDLTAYYNIDNSNDEFYFNGCRMKYEYDSNGNAIKSKEFSYNYSDGEMEESEYKTEFEYDKNGILKSCTEYDDNGKKSSEVHYSDVVVVYDMDDYKYGYRYDY